MTSRATTLDIYQFQLGCQRYRCTIPSYLQEHLVLLSHSILCRSAMFVHLVAIKSTAEDCQSRDTVVRQRYLLKPPLSLCCCLSLWFAVELQNDNSTKKKYPKQSFNVDEHFIKILNNLLSAQLDYLKNKNCLEELSPALYHKGTLSQNVP